MVITRNYSALHHPSDPQMFQAVPPAESRLTLLSYWIGYGGNMRKKERAQIYNATAKRMSGRRVHGSLQHHHKPTGVMFFDNAKNHNALEAQTPAKC